MNNTKCSLFVIGRTGVGKKNLISSLFNYNNSHLENTGVFSKTDWVINTRYGQIDVEIKEKQKLDNLTVNLLSKREANKLFILFVTDLDDYKERLLSYKEELNLLKKFSTKAIVMVAFVARNNDGLFKSIRSQFKKTLPFVEYFFPISSANNGKENVYEFSFTLKQIITSHASGQLALAKALIKRNFDLKEKTLDLGNCNITSLNQVKELFQNTHLENLILSNEWGEYRRGKYIRMISENRDSPNILFSLPEEMSKLKKLKVLICGGNWRGKRSSKEHIQWQITDISVLTTLPNLTVINVSNNKVNKIGAISKLEKLNKLYLNNNDIDHFPDIGDLRELREIYLSNNRLTKVNFLEKLPNIKTIDLHSNRIKDISPLKSIISKLNIKDSKWEVNSISIHGNPLNVPPREIVSKGKKSVIAYFNQLEAERKIKLKSFKNRDIKLILVGNSNAGKSTLINWLQTKKVDKKIATTHWLNFGQWVATSNRKTFNVRYFDFGGQEYYHDTHYLFFTNRTAYVLLWEAPTNRFDEIEVDQRQDDGAIKRVKIQTFSLDYWLDSIMYHTRRRRKSILEKSVEKLLEDRDDVISQSVRLGEDLTKNVNTTNEKKGDYLDGEENILVTQNKLDSRKDKIFLDESSLKVDYPKIFDFTEISVYQKRGLLTFQTYLFEIFNNLEVVTQEYLGTWGYLKEKIESNKFSKHLTLLEFKKYCNNEIIHMPELLGKDQSQIKSVLFNDQDTQIFAEFLSDIGICLFYPENPILKNKIFLNQTIILKDIHIALNGLNQLDGEVAENKIAEALPKSMSSDEIENVIELMIHFKILFKHPSKKKTFIAPLYLPKDPPQGVKIFQSLFNQPVYRYQYRTYIQKNIILDFFHNFGQKAVREANSDALYYYWRDGIILRDDSSDEIVMVKFISGNYDEQSAYLELYQVKDSTDEKLLNEVVSYFDDINEGLTVVKLVSANGKDYVPLEIIVKNENEANWIFQYGGKLFKLTDFKRYLKENIKMKKVFISYSKIDSQHLIKLENHLSVLKRNGTIGTWNCRKLLPGEKWDGKIRAELEEADLILFLVSDDFLATDYIWDIEIKRAIERDKDPDDSVTVVPIIVRSCDWEDSPLGVFNTAPKKAQVINTSKDIDEAWTSVVKELKQLLKK